MKHNYWDKTIHVKYGQEKYLITLPVAHHVQYSVVQYDTGNGIVHNNVIISVLTSYCGFGPLQLQWQYGGGGGGLTG